MERMRNWKPKGEMEKRTESGKKGLDDKREVQR